METDSSPALSDVPALHMVFWEVTAGCNLECRHCRRLDVSRALMDSDLSHAEGLQLIDQIAACGQPILVLSGGEPLMRPDIFELARYAADRGLPVALATNGMLLTRDVARQIRDAGIGRVSISVDGHRADLHDDFRGQPGAFAGALTALGRLRQVGISRQINCTVTTENVEHLDAIYRLASMLEVDALYFFLLVPVGCGLEIRASHQITPERYEEVLHWIWERDQESSMHLRAVCAPHYFRIVRQKRPPRVRAASSSRWSAMTRGCLAGSGICFVSHTGNVSPCGYLPLTVGNVREIPLDELWNHAELFARLRNVEQLEGKCGFCEFRRVCMGCRARAFGETGNAFSQEPFCTYTPHLSRRLGVKAVCDTIQAT